MLKTCAACQTMRRAIAALFTRHAPEIAIDELKISQYGALIDPDGTITYVGPFPDGVWQLVKWQQPAAWLHPDNAVIERRSTWGK